MNSTLKTVLIVAALIYASNRVMFVSNLIGPRVSA